MSISEISNVVRATNVFTLAGIRVGEYMRKHIETDFQYIREFEDYVKALDAFYMEFYSPTNPPLAVRRGIVLKFADDLPQAERVLRTLGYDGLMKCWYFTWAGMFCGVEPDGHIHT